MIRFSPRNPAPPIPRWRQAWVWPALSLAALAGQIGLQAAGCRGMVNLAAHRPILVDAAGLLNLSGLGFVALGLLIALYRPENRIGRLASLTGLGIMFLLFSANYVSCGVHGPLSLPLVKQTAWVSSLLGWAVILLIFVLLPLLFPNGEFPSPGWRRFAQVALSLIALALLVTALWPGPIALFEFYGIPELVNPAALPFSPSPRWDALVDGLLPTCMVLASLGASASLILRWRRSRGEARQQLKWFAYFLATVGLFAGGVELYGALVDREIFRTWFYYLVLVAWWTGFPAVIGIALLRYRLYDIDVIIRRTLVYAALTSALGLIYFSGVVGLQQVFRTLTVETGRSQFAVVLSTLAIAALFSPLRKRIQQGIDRRFYRRKYDAERTLQAFGASLREEVDLDQLSERLIAVVQETMQPESVSLWLQKPAQERAR